MHTVVLAEDATVSMDPELDSGSKRSSEQVEIPVLRITNGDLQNIDTKNNPQKVSQDSTHSVTTSNNTNETKESNTKDENLNSRSEEKEEDSLGRVYRECKGRLSCVQQRIVTLIDRLDAMKSIPMFEGYVTIEKTSEEVQEKDVIADSAAALLSRVDRYLRSHSIRVQMPETEGYVPEILGRFLQAKTLDFSLGMLATQDASEG